MDVCGNILNEYLIVGTKVASSYFSFYLIQKQLSRSLRLRFLLLHWSDITLSYHGLNILCNFLFQNVLYCVGLQAFKVFVARGTGRGVSGPSFLNYIGLSLPFYILQAPYFYLIRFGSAHHFVSYFVWLVLNHNRPVFTRVKAAMSFPLQIRNLLFNPLLQLLLLFFCQLVVAVEVFDESPFIVLKIPSLLISRSKGNNTLRFMNKRVI